MHRVIAIDVDGSGTEFRMHEEAYDALRHYLDDARARLADDPDQADVIGDIEGSIASRLAERLAGAERVLAIADIDAVLAAVGPVGEGIAAPAPSAPPTAPGPTPPPIAGPAAASGWAAASATPPPKRRKLYRIKEGQWLAGVCVGIAAYSEIDVDWIHWLLFFGILVTAGILLVPYLIIAFLLPVVPTHEAWLAAIGEQPASA
jgi:phage shock protein PspC (stress-responsive transcriptional regulator)